MLPAANRLLQAWRTSGEDRTFSAGIAIHDRNQLPEQTLQNADQAGLRAKDEGKDRVCLYPPGGWLDEESAHVGGRPTPSYFDFRPGRRRAHLPPASGA